MKLKNNFLDLFDFDFLLEFIFILHSLTFIVLRFICFLFNEFAVGNILDFSLFFFILGVFCLLLLFCLEVIILYKFYPKKNNKYKINQMIKKKALIQENGVILEEYGNTFKENSNIEPFENKNFPSLFNSDNINEKKSKMQLNKNLINNCFFSHNDDNKKNNTLLKINPPEKKKNNDFLESNNKLEEFDEYEDNNNKEENNNFSNLSSSSNIFQNNKIDLSSLKKHYFYELAEKENKRHETKINKCEHCDSTIQDRSFYQHMIKKHMDQLSSEELAVHCLINLKKIKNIITTIITVTEKCNEKANKEFKEKKLYQDFIKDVEVLKKILLELNF